MAGVRPVRVLWSITEANIQVVRRQSMIGNVFFFVDSIRTHYRIGYIPGKRGKRTYHH